MWSHRRGSFERYLNGLTSAKHFMSEGAIRFLLTVPTANQKKKIYARLREVDPQGLKDLMSLILSLAQKKRYDRELPYREEADEIRVIVAESEWQSTGIRRVRFIEQRGILNVIAACLAAGYSPQETADMLNVDVYLVNKVSSADIRRMRKKGPQLIVELADQRVMRDLLKDEITETTTRADRIATSRRKQAVDAWEKTQRGGPHGSGAVLPTTTAKDAEDQAVFFGASPKPIDVESEEVTDEDSETESTGEG